MSNVLVEFSEAASRLARNPIGIIALFQVLVYGIAGFVTSRISPANTAAFLPLIWFLVLYPVIVIGIFTYLVVCHHNKLYAPGDFSNEDNFMSGVASDRRYTAEEIKKVEREPAQVTQKEDNL